MTHGAPLHNRKYLLGRRRALRRALTPAEATLWIQLRCRQLDGWKFRRQHSIGPYIVDFYCCPARLAIELDGSAHDSCEANANDEHRSSYLAAHGIEVMRFLNDDVIHRLEGVLHTIGARLREIGERGRD